jgi:hypothetical protein
MSELLARVLSALRAVFRPVEILFQPFTAFWRLLSKVVHRIVRGYLNLGPTHEGGPGQVIEPGGSAGVPLVVAIFVTPIVVSILYWRNGFGLTWFVGGTVTYLAVCLWLRRIVGSPMIPAKSLLGIVRRYTRRFAANIGVRGADRIGLALATVLAWECLPRFTLPFPILWIRHLFGGHTEFAMPAVFFAIAFSFVMSEPTEHRIVELLPIRLDRDVTILDPDSTDDSITVLVRPRLGKDADELGITEAELVSLEDRTFEWELAVRGTIERYQLICKLSSSRCQAARDRNPGKPTGADQYWDWITRGRTLDVARVARQLSRITREQAHTPYSEICNVLAFVQSIPYSVDVDSTSKSEYWRYPIETLFDGTGDCEDTAVLAVALLTLLGHDAVLIDMPGHLAFGVASEETAEGRYLSVPSDPKRLYYYCETTANGWKVGELPSTIAPESLSIVIDPTS